jgi:hypothetical protein
MSLFLIGVFAFFFMLFFIWMVDKRPWTWSNSDANQAKHRTAPILLPDGSAPPAAPNELKAEQKQVANLTDKKMDAVKQQLLHNRATFIAKTWGNKPAIRAIDLYEEGKKDIKAARAKYSFVLIEGTIDRATFFGVVGGALFYLRHRPDNLYRQDKISLAFFLKGYGPDYDQGFEFTLEPRPFVSQTFATVDAFRDTVQQEILAGPGAVTAPIGAGDTCVFSGLCEFKDDGSISINFPRLERRAR